MSWTEVRRDERIVEWERSDGHATLRLRRGPSAWHVRFDRLFQAPEGPAYESRRFDDEDTARETLTAWKETYDVSES